MRHELTQVVLRALAAVVAGPRTFVAIGEWIGDLDPTQRAALGCRRTGTAYRVPSEPTVRCVLPQRDADAVDTVLSRWLTEEEHWVDDALTIDGKSLRGSAHDDRLRPVHVLAALIHRTGQVVGQVLVETKTNEISQRKDWLAPLDVAGRVVTVDALAAQTATARYLVEPT